MKATELMIGDWVRVPELEYHDEITDDNGFCRIKQLRTADLDVDTFKELAYSDLEPISLTAEILVKNGLEKRCSDELVLFDNSKIDTTGEYIIIRYFVNTQRVWLCKGIGVDENEIRINCQYVHELQHALKLCGIDKEIVL